MRPVAAGQQVAEPLVRELVRDERVAVGIEGGALVVEDGVGQRRRGGVLHAAEDEVGDDDLGVLLVRITHADLLVEEADHRWGAPEGAAGVVLAAGLDVVRHAQAVGRVGHLGEFAGHQRHEIGHVRHGLPPVVRARAIGVLAPLHEAAVGEREPARGHGREHLGRRLLVREVEAGEPVARVLVLALRPDLARAVRVALVRQDEVEPAPRVAAVLHSHGHGLARPQRPAELDVERAAGLLVRERHAVHRHGRDIELDGVEVERGEAVVDGRERVRGRAEDAAVVEVEPDLEADVADVGGAIAAVVRRVAGQRERLASAVVEGGGVGAAADRHRLVVEVGHRCVPPPVMLGSAFSLPEQRRVTSRVSRRSRSLVGSPRCTGDSRSLSPPSRSPRC